MATVGAYSPWQKVGVLRVLIVFVGSGESALLAKETIPSCPGTELSVIGKQAAQGYQWQNGKVSVLPA